MSDDGEDEGVSARHLSTSETQLGRQGRTGINEQKNQVKDQQTV
jgi:hypothetical protein